MTETIETADETAEGVDETADESTAEEAEAAEGNSKESDAAEEGAAEDEEPQADEDAEPPTRKPRTNADWVALRRQQKLNKQKAGKGEQGEAEAEDVDEDDDVDEEDAKLIDKRIERHLAPLKEKEYLQELRTEINEFVATNPDFKPFAEKALKWAQHPSWKDVPTKQLMYAAAGDKLLKMGAIRAKQVAIKTQKTKTGTNSGGNSGGTKPVAEMTDAEFEQEVLRVKTQSRE